MKLKFIGTKGYIKEKSGCHSLHSSLLVSYYGKKVMIDCGEDWLGKIRKVSPEAIIITHAHPDHVWGLKKGAPCPVYATRDAWKVIKDYPIEHKNQIRINVPKKIKGMVFKAFRVIHSTRAPAVGYRITAGGATIFYVPDVVYIPGRKKALKDIQVYIGDGATIERSMIRKPGDKLIGHASIRTQCTWCKRENVRRAFFTHCGSEIVKGPRKKIDKTVKRIGKERGVVVSIACDGYKAILR